jgi:hypothetical protein
MVSFHNHRSCRIGNRPVSDERAHQERTGEAKRRRGKHTGTKMRIGGLALHESASALFACATEELEQSRLQREELCGSFEGNSSDIQKTTERIMLFGKIWNSISVHTGKELP